MGVGWEFWVELRDLREDWATWIEIQGLKSDVLCGLDVATARSKAASGQRGGHGGDISSLTGHLAEAFKGSCPVLHGDLNDEQPLDTESGQSPLRHSDHDPRTT